MSAKVIELPSRTRGYQAARELREGVIGVLKEIHRHGGDAAFQVWEFQAHAPRFK